MKRGCLGEEAMMTTFAKRALVHGGLLLACTLLPSCKSGDADSGPSTHGACNADSDWEPNEAPEDACLLDLPASLDGKIAAAGKDTDYFAFEAKAGVVYTVELTNTSGSGGFDERVNLSASLAGSDVSLVGETAAMARSPTQYRELRPLEAGTVVLKLNGGAPATYALRVLASDAVERDATTSEPNNTPSTAAPLEFGTLFESELSLPEDHVDDFSFEAKKGEVYTLELINTSGVGGHDERLLMAAWLGDPGADGTPLLPETAALANSPAVYREIRPLSTGQVIVSVYGAASATYTLRALASAAVEHDATTSEPNNTPSTATPLELGVPVSSDLSMPADHEDHFRLAVEKGRTYAVTHTATAGVDHIGIVATLLDADGAGGVKLFEGGTDPNTRYYEFTAPKSGDVDLALTAPGDDSYELVAFPSTADGLKHDESGEPNQTPGTAAPLELDMVVSADINTTDDYVDCFEVTVKAGMPYTLLATNTGGSGQFNLSGSINGAELFHDGSGDQNRSRSFPFVPAVSGQVLLQLERPSAPTSYELSVTQD
jgi:hypothetical protein